MPELELGQASNVSETRPSPEDVFRPASKLRRLLRRPRGLRAKFGFGLFPQRGVDLLIERRASGGILAERMVFAAHQIRAIGESATNAQTIELTVLLQPMSKIGLCQCTAADAGEGD